MYPFWFGFMSNRILKVRNLYCIPIIIKNPLKNGISIRNILVAIYIGRARNIII